MHKTAATRDASCSSLPEAIHLEPRLLTFAAPQRAARVTGPELSLGIAQCQEQDASPREPWDQEKDPQASRERAEDSDWLVSGM